MSKVRNVMEVSKICQLLRCEWVKENEEWRMTEVVNLGALNMVLPLTETRKYGGGVYLEYGS